MESHDDRKWVLIVLAFIVGLLGGLLGGAIIALLMGTTGPQGPAGAEGSQGPQGVQGPAGTPGTNGTDAILQILQNRNDTQVDTTSYALTQWFNMSAFDSSMKMVVNVQENSMIFAEFSGTHYFTSEGSIWVRLVIDSIYNSSVYMCSCLAPASPIFNMPGHTELLTDPLSAGYHTIEVQFLREAGEPRILDRTLTVMEITSP